MHVLIPALHRPLRPTGVCRHAANLANCLIETEWVSQVTLLSGLPKLANSLRPDIIHMSFPLPFIRSRFNAPVVSTIHDLYPYEFPENFGEARATFNKLFLRQNIASSDGLCCVSQMTEITLEKYFEGISNQKKVSVIYNYVDFADVVPQIPESLEPNPKTPFIMSVAQHRKNKNLDWLIRAYSSRLRTRQVDEATQLVIVGSTGPESDNLEALVRTLDLQGRVSFLSALNDSELCWLYQNSQLFVIPSSTEGFCLPLVEALASGCRVVCSDIPIFQEVGSSTCTFFDLKDQPIEKLETAIDEAIASANTTDSSVNNRFSKSYVAELLFDFYAALTVTD